MSTTWNETSYAPPGHTDTEHMEISNHFNAPARGLAGASKPSTRDSRLLDGGEGGDEKVDDDDDDDEEAGNNNNCNGGGSDAAIMNGEEASNSNGSADVEVGPRNNVGVAVVAWLQVLAGHLMNVNTWGTINSYGLFLAHYQSRSSSPSLSSLSTSTLSWPASIQIFLLCFLGTFSGRALDAGYFQSLLIAGCCFQVMGMFLTSFCTEFWRILLAQGVLMGIGHGLVFTTMVGNVSSWFSQGRAAGLKGVALGIVLSGSVTGGVIFPIIAERLEDIIGWGWTVRVMGFVMVANVVVIWGLARRNPDARKRKSGPWVERGAFREVPYSLFAVGTWLVLWPVYGAYDYINIYATNIIKVPQSTSLTILLLFNLAAYPGRILPALASDFYLGPLNTLILLSFSCTLTLFLWPLLSLSSPPSLPYSPSSLPSLITFTLIYGALNGGVQGLFMSALTSLSPDLSKIGTRTGMIFTILAFCTLTGAPIGGALIDAMGGGFLGLQIWGGVCMAAGAVVLVAARVKGAGWVLRRRM